MLRRTLLAILLLCLSAPAMATACVSDSPLSGQHAASQAGAHHAHHSSQPAAPQPASQGGKHECIGCIAPLDKHAYRPVSRPDYGLASFWPALSARMAEAILPPEPEPPRPLA